MPHHSHPLIFHPHKKLELKEIYASILIRSLAISIVGVFIPLYLLDIGYSLHQVFLFLAMSYGLYLFAAPAAAELAHIIGLKKTSLLGPFLGSTYLLGLYFLKAIPPSSWILYCIAAVSAVAAMLYWVPVNTHFSKCCTVKKAASETSYLYVSEKLASLIAPFIGALIIAHLSYGILFAIGCIILKLSAAPLFLSKDYKSKIKYSWLAIFTKTNARFQDMFFAQGILVIVLTALLPVYVYLITKNYELVGGAAVFIGLGMAVLAVIFGKISNKFDKKLILRVGALLSTAVWISLLFTKNLWAILVLAFVAGVAFMLIDIPLYASFCTKLNEDTRIEFMALRDIALGAGRAVVPLIAVFLTFKWEASFAFAAVASAYLALAAKK